VGVSRGIIENRLQVSPSTKPKKKNLRKMSKEKVEATKVEVQRLLDAGFITKVAYPQWLANVMMVRKTTVHGGCAQISQTWTSVALKMTSPS
jgi:hypothetical protein